MNAKVSHELLTIQQAAEKLNVSPKTLRKWGHNGKIQTVRLGRSVRITVDELSRIIEEGVK